ncbi:hypothetical protein [Streptomyces boluensis]|uniref:Uncharacterized protein n=1 Tax=Streptomyces boluensis TaxID=1775135 RepID=A0A964UJ41_9ACTN|nr:hypothetical protein [Streptomyces boluensis]NBE49946.1 hypothetical protein [Streptomyces boluensis]
MWDLSSEMADAAVVEGIDQRVAFEFGDDQAIPTTPWSSLSDGTLCMPAGPIVRFFATGVVAGYCAHPSRTDLPAAAVRAAAPRFSSPLRGPRIFVIAPPTHDRQIQPDTGVP